MFVTDEDENEDIPEYDENGFLVSSNSTSNYLKAKDLKDMINEYKIEKIVENSVYENEENEVENITGSDNDKSYDFMN